MRIGIMLRHYDQHGGGVRVYTRNLLRELLALEIRHEFVLLYNDPRLIGTYAGRDHVREVSIAGRSAALWDQLSLFRIEKREKLDLLFNLKYSLPLAASCRTMFVCHGLDWYAMPWGSKWTDRLSHRYLVPRYASKADAIIAISETTRQHLHEYLKVDVNRVHTIHYGVDESFRRRVPASELDAIRQRYELPNRFFLYCGQIYPPKNFGRLLRAFARVGPSLNIPLVIAGEHRWLSRGELELIDTLQLDGWVRRLGWMDRETLPGLYQLAEAVLLPSIYESFGLPVLEGMASGTPVVTTNRHGPAEVAGTAAVLVDPESVDSIAEGMQRVAMDADLRRALGEAGRRRAAEFSWMKCARELLTVLDEFSVGSV